MRRLFLVLAAAFVLACRPAHAPETAGAIAAYTPPAIRLKYRGTNLNGADFGQNVPGVLGRDYAWPKPEEVDYFLDRGMNHFRIGFRPERVQPELSGPLNEEEYARLAELVAYATGHGATVMLEPHTSYRHHGRIYTETQLGNFWGRIAGRLKGNPRVQINLTNEPKDMPTEQVVALANAGLREIRRVGFRGLVLVPGNGWTGGGHWTSRWYGTPNAVAMLKVVDPGANMAFEVHQYLDDDANGDGECVSETIGVERLSGFVAWLRANGRVGWLGEFGAKDTPRCRAAVTKMLEYVEANYDVWLGWDWWSAGSRWTSTYPMLLGPTREGEPEKPQMAWLRPFLPCAR